MKNIMVKGGKVDAGIKTPILSGGGFGEAGKEVSVTVRVSKHEIFDVWKRTIRVDQICNAHEKEQCREIVKECDPAKPLIVWKDTGHVRNEGKVTVRGQEKEERMEKLVPLTPLTDPPND